jgi:chemotaxis family two-component system sensor histidine kinase/response regulator PixL
MAALIPVIDGVTLVERLPKELRHYPSLGQDLQTHGLAAASNSEDYIEFESDRTIMAHSHASVNPTLPSLHTATTPTVLVVDDAASLRKTLAMSLERAGYRVLQAGDGWEALKQLQSNAK